MKAHCKRGHEYTDENTIWNKQPNGRRTRKCRTCHNSLHRKGSRENQKAARQQATRDKAHVRMQENSMVVDLKTKQLTGMPLPGGVQFMLEWQLLIKQLKQCGVVLAEETVTHIGIEQCGITFRVET